MRSGVANKMIRKFSSNSPIDGSVVWSGDATQTKDLVGLMARSKDAATRWKTVDFVDRANIVMRFADYLGRHREHVSDLITREVGKLPWDAAGEVNAAIAKADRSIQAIRERRLESIHPSQEATKAIRYHPIGVTLVLGPFNFPLHLPGGQIIPALLAGNSVVFKPSEQATAVGHWIADAWKQAGLPEDVFQMIVGGVEIAVAAIDEPAVSGVFLTGSRAAGLSIHRQLAGRPEVMLALELGGNNPIVISEQVDPELATSIVSFSAFVSSGQRCTCARRAIYVGDRGEQQIDAVVRATRRLKVGLPSDTGAQIGPLISEAAAESLRQTYDTLIGLGCEPLIHWNADSRRDNLVHPVILDASQTEGEAYKQIGALEWFGPMLVVHRAKDLETATRLAAETPYGLSAALVGGDRDHFERFVRDVGAGVVNWNRPTTGAAGTLPFGGRGHSGNHRPAGFFAVDSCNEPVSSVQLDEPDQDDPWSIAK